MRALFQALSLFTPIPASKSKMESCVFPLPPLSEQQRIVDRIESLFAKLDEAKQKVQDALDSFFKKCLVREVLFRG